MQNINIRFNGQSNLASVQKEVLGLNASMEALNLTMAKAARAQGQGAGAYMQDMMKTQKLMREVNNANIAARGGYLTETIKVTAATTDFNDRLAKQKIHFKDIYKNMSVVKGAYKEQIALQNMFMATYEKNASGKLMADVFVPSQTLQGMKSMRQELGYIGNLLSSGSLQAQNWGKNTQWAGRQLMVGFTVPTAIAAAAVAKFGFEADKAMTKIVKVYDNGANGITLSTNQIRDNAMQSAKSMASTYGAAADDTLNIQAELAAAGKTGNDLVAATAQVSKAMVLGELDRSSAIKTSIALQDAFNLSVDQSNEKWNLFNSIENATSLSMADITDSLPRVSGIMNALGASVEDTTVLLTAFKAAGIDAVEGATALKSISFKMLAPSTKAKDTFKSLTGLDYDSILKQTKGEIIPTLLKLGDTMKGLTKLQKVNLVSDLIGIHQGSKFFGLVEQMANLNDETTQVGRAFAVANSDASTWAETARGEIEALRESISNRFQRAVQTAKVNMMQLGLEVLKFIVPIVEMGAKIVDSINHLSDGKKAIFLWGSAIIGAVGIVTMFTGLLLNLIGMFGRTVGGVLKLIAPMKILNTETAAAALQAKMASHGFESEATVLREMEAAMRAVVAQQIAMQRHAAMPGFQMVGGQLMKPTGQTSATGAPVMGMASAAETRRWHEIDAASRTVDEASARTGKNWGAISQSIAGSTAALAMAGSFMTKQDSGLNKAFNATAMAALVASALPLGKIGTKVASSWKSAGSAMAVTNKVAAAGRATAAGLGTAWSKVTGVLMGPWGVVAVATLTAITFAVKKHQQALENQRRQYEKTRDSAKSWADILGFEYTEQAKLNGKGSSNSAVSDRQQLNAKVVALQKANDELYNNLTKLQGKDQRVQLDAAIDEAMKVRLHGGTVDAALEAARVAMAAMKTYMSKEELAVIINAKVNLEDPREAIGRYADKLSADMDAAIKDKFETKDDLWESLSRMGGHNGINSTAKEQIKSGVKSWYETIQTADDETRKSAINNMNRKFSDALVKGYKQAVANGDAANVGSFSEFAKNVSNGTGKADPNGAWAVSGATAELMDNLRGAGSANKQFIDSLAELNGISKESYKNIYNLTDLYQLLGVTSADNTAANKKEAASERELKNARIAARAAALSMDPGKSYDNDLYKERMLRAEQSRLAAATRDTGAAARSAGMSWAEFDSIMKDSGVTSADVANSMQGAMSKTMDTVYQAADAMLQDRFDSQMTALQQKGEGAMNALDARAEASRVTQQNKEEALNARLEAADKRLQKSQQDRRKAIEASYDARIKKIDEAIKKEQSAEDIRQKIFEAEKTRIERMAQMYNKNIDFTTAVSTGNFDEAAKITNDMAATEQSWGAQDAAGASQSASEKRVATLEGQKTAIEAGKQARLDALNAVEEREKAALDASKKRQQDQLKAETDRINKSLDAEKKAIQDRNAANEAALRRRQEFERLGLQQNLAVLKEFVPKNEAELNKHIARVEKAYGLYGGSLTKSGTEWGTIVGGALSTNVAAAAENLRNKVRWADIGKAAAEEMIKSSMGLNLAQFQQYLKTGDYGAAMKYKENAGKSTKGGQVADNRHAGGIIGDGRGSRVGFSGRSQSQSEVTVNALKGEGFLTRRAVNTLGADFIDAANKGRIPKNIGGPDLAMGPAGVMGAVMAAMQKSVINKAVQGVAGQMAASAGGGGYFGPPLAGFEAFFRAIAGQESGGNYGAVNASSGALGKYQIMPANVTPWAKQYLHQYMTPSQFLHTPALQDELARAVLSSYFNAYGARGAAAKWYSGDQRLSESTAPQSGGYPSIKAYVDAIMGRMAAFGVTTGGTGGWIRPADGPRTSPFGMRVNPVTGQYRLHAGSDIGAPAGAAIRAARGGRVASAGPVSGYGNYTVIDHGGNIRTAYAHQSRIGVRPGQSVIGGQQIGNVGSTGNSTGPHLHFEYIKNGVRVNPNMIIPGLLTGASVLRGGLANLHAGETVVPKKLSKSLHNGIENLENNGGMRYNIENISIKVEGPVTSETARTLKNAVKGALQELERENGPKRKVS